MISITHIEVEAFKNFAETQSLSIADLSAGLHFVRGVNGANSRLGSNGAGKSTFFSDAVAWCLYGKTIGGLRTTDVKSWLTDKAPRVAVTLQRGGSAYAIQRGPKSSALTINGKTVGQEEVDALVGISFAAFAQAVVWGQAQPLFFDLVPAAKMSLLSDALDLERWERRAEAAGARARKLEASLTALDGELRGLEAAEEHAEAALEEAKGAAQRWGKEHAQRLSELADAIRELQAQHDALEKKREKADINTESSALSIDQVRAAAERGRAELRKLEDEYRDLKADVRRAEDDLATTESQLTAFAETGTCPTCGQEVKKRDADKHVKELKIRVKDLETELDEMSSDDQDFKKVIEETRQVLTKDEAELRTLEKAISDHETALRVYERDTAAARTRLANAEDELRRAEEAQNPHRDASAQAKQRLKEIRDKLDAGEEKAAQYEASIERAQFWAKGFREIRLMIIDDMIDDLRETTAEVMDELGLGDWSVEYVTERETKSKTVQRALSVLIRSPSAPDGVRWEAYSGGERQRLRLAGALALSEVLLSHAGSGLDFRVFDEPTRGLSREGVRDLCEALAAYAEDAGLRIMYVDHQSEDGLTFASTVTVTGGPDGATVSM